MIKTSSLLASGVRNISPFDVIVRFADASQELTWHRLDWSGP